MSLSSDSEIKLYITQFISMVNSVIINQKWNKINLIKWKLVKCIVSQLSVTKGSDVRVMSK